MSSALYWLAIRTYVALVRAASLFNPKAKLLLAGRKDLLRQIRYALINERRPRVWMHCASLGEFEQGRPVLEKLRKQYPQYAFVLTFFSPSGYEARKNYTGADYIFYLPFDSVYNAKRFLAAVQPKLAIFVKYELWYFFLMQLARKGIPAILVSAIFRKEQPFFQWYGRLHRRMLHTFSQIFVQNEESKQLLHKINVDTVTIAGDTRFDRVIEAAHQQETFAEAKSFCVNHKIIVAGSTWPDDEEFLEKLLQMMPETWRMILVPHEIDDAHISDIEKRFEEKYIKWTEWREPKSERVLIVNKIGLLFHLYGYADVVWVGGGFGKDGVHNVLEAAVHSKPVAFGPVYQQFAEAEELLKCGGAITVSKPELFKQTVISWKKDPYSYAFACKAAGDYVLGKGGATQVILDHLEAKKTLSNS